MDADRSGSLTTQARRIYIARISHHISPETTCLVTGSVTVSITNSTAGMDGLHDGPTRPDRLTGLSDCPSWKQRDIVWPLRCRKKIYFCVWSR